MEQWRHERKNISHTIGLGVGRIGCCYVMQQLDELATLFPTGFFSESSFLGDNYEGVSKFGGLEASKCSLNSTRRQLYTSHRHIRTRVREHASVLQQRKGILAFLYLPLVSPIQDLQISVH